MGKATWIARIGIIMTSALLFSGCVTNIRQPQSSPMPSTERFGTFGNVYYENITIAPAFASATPNQRAARKINEETIMGLRNVFTDLKVVDEALESTDTRSLIIRPHIVEIKFIGGAARFWVGALAGSSAVLMQVTYINMPSGNVLANPEFYRSASAFGGGMSMGTSDNMMLTMIAQDIITYTSSNR